MTGPDLSGQIPILDTHIHLFDPTRPQGVPYRGRAGTPTYERGAFPDAYAREMGPLGVVGAIKVEASPWIEDNLWVLGLIAGETMMVAAVGNLKPEDPDFAETLERFARNPLFRGIRYGNLWGYSLAAQVANPVFVDGLKRVAGMGLVMDASVVNLDLLAAVVRASDAAPELTIVLDHLPRLEPAARDEPAYARLLRELATRPNVVAKLSGLVDRVDGRAVTRTARLDRLVETFGEDRILFGSAWPSDGVDTVKAARAYMAARPRRLAEKYFWRNSLRVYGWAPRTEAQARLVALSRAERPAAATP